MNSSPVKSVAFLTSALGFFVLMLLPAGPKGEPSLAPLLFVLLLIPAWFLPDDREVFPGYRKAWNWAVGVFLVVSSLDLLINQRPPQLTLIHQLGFLLLSKAFTNRQRRDYLIMLLLTLLMFFVVGLLTRSLLLVPAICLFLFLSVVLLILLQVVAEGEILQRHLKDSLNSGIVVPLSDSDLLDKGIVPDRRLWNKFRGPALRMVLGCFAMSALIFYAWPRLRGEPFPYPMTGNPEDRRQVILSGFTREVDLGSLTTLLEDPTPVMRVKLLQAYFPQQELYLRGGSMDNFDGLRWFNTFHSPRANKAVHPNRQTRKHEFRSPATEAQVVQQEIQYLNFPQRTLFALPGLVAVQGIEGDILHEPGETFLSQNDVHEAFRAWSDLRSLRGRDRPSETEESLTDKELSCYLQWPKGVRQDQFRRFVDNTTPDVADRFSRAGNLAHYLSQNYEYTTDLRGYTSDNPVEQFLFKKHRGHCELFATSFVMLLRSVDIPARLVVGFHGGRPLSGNEEYEIRQKDAHTWVEAWFEDRGWVSFDPTPEPPLPVYSNRILFAAVAGWFQGLSKKGHDFILDYDLQSQIGALNRATGYVSDTGKWIADSRLFRFSSNESRKTS
ncbi:MAG: DUF3488 and transglutaminase-like domain-containing protein [bacterium]